MGLAATLKNELSAQLRSLYAPVAQEIVEVEAILQAEFRNSDTFVNDLAQHGFRLGGKRLRPALVLLSARICGELRPVHLELAAIMEMVHTATLLHDDVLDEATIRRHAATVNARWNNEASILLGDYLLARAMAKAGALQSPFACQAIGEAAQIVCEGELRQVQWRGCLDLSEHDYLAIIADKTAELTACCCRLGAFYADRDGAAVERMARFGRYLGIAFQIADDLLDVVGEESVAGKSLGTDLAKQKATLPLIRLLGQASDRRAEMLAALSLQNSERIPRFRAWFQESDSLDYSRAKAEEYARLAVEELEGLPASPARDALIAVATYSVSRSE